MVENPGAVWTKIQRGLHYFGVLQHSYRQFFRKFVGGGDPMLYLLALLPRCVFCNLKNNKQILIKKTLFEF
jgi:hypothetical protein